MNTVDSIQKRLLEIEKKINIKEEDGIDPESKTTDVLFLECQIMAERVKDMKFVDNWSRYPSRLSIRTMKNAARPERYVQIKVMPSFGGNASFKVEEETLKEALVVLHRQMSERLTR